MTTVKAAEDGGGAASWRRSGGAVTLYSSVKFIIRPLRASQAGSIAINNCWSLKSAAQSPLLPGC